MSDSVAERVAEALARSVGINFNMLNDGDTPIMGQENTVYFGREYWRRLARVAIQAMREPVELRIGDPVRHPHGGQIGRVIAIHGEQAWVMNTDNGHHYTYNLTELELDR